MMIIIKGKGSKSDRRRLSHRDVERGIFGCERDGFSRSEMMIGLNEYTRGLNSDERREVVVEFADREKK